jgi:exodeoxyribonuclease VII large subunit
MSVQAPILTVTELNRQVRSWLEHDMGVIAVQGELSNVSKPASGHLYFTLKDTHAQLRCVYFRNRHGTDDRNALDNGQQVLLHGTLSLYEARGDYQLIVERLQDVGLGDLYRQFELLKAKLAATGIFDAARKKLIPPYPQVIGIVSSASGAALQDILSTLARRYPIAQVLVFHAEVQGKQAPQQLIQAIALAHADKRSDVLILARGGGSMEDLWAFNDERLAHVIANSTIPIVSGVGHETDFTIADFVADLRAATPTAAAEAVSPHHLDLINLFKTIESRLLIAIKRHIQHQQLLIQHHMQQLTSPKHLISTHWQSLDYLRSHLSHAIKQYLTHQRQQLQYAITRLEAKNPNKQLQQEKARVLALDTQLNKHMNDKIQQLKHQLTALLATLHAVSPLATLDRGYAIATRNHQVIWNSQAIQVGDTIDIRLAKGRLQTTVINKE